MRLFQGQSPTSSEASIASSNEFQIAETATFKEGVQAAIPKRYYEKLIKDVYPRLRSNPYFGPNIKRLKGAMRSILRYRIGDYRLFYTVDPERKYVYILALENRKDSYKK